MKKKIYSIDGYSEMDIDFEKVDLLGAEDLASLLKSFTDGIIVSARRDISVYATKVIVGSEVDCRSRFSMHGRVYAFEKKKRTITQRDVDTNSMMILYTDGEVQVVKGERFEEAFIMENKAWDLYKPVDYAKKFVTITKHVYFKTPWGEIVYAPAGSKLCIEYTDERDFFIVTNSFFKTAYRTIGEVGNIDDLQFN